MKWISLQISTFYTVLKNSTKKSVNGIHIHESCTDSVESSFCKFSEMFIIFTDYNSLWKKLQNSKQEKIDPNHIFLWSSLQNLFLSVKYDFTEFFPKFVKCIQQIL